eukprot:TRINITY_DN121336_c0_g1_i1.p1 TRINITY_DN121336_c0_g1~~TRINITY_DN121336_c0_g1_i1.p1  ORF type:complete len:847 (+),score=149.58 TRINITY_DN121336_c0_g1_i1:51-2591(+)
MRLVLAVVHCVASGVASSLPVWKLSDIASDLRCASCAKNPAAVLTSGSQSGCAADEIYKPVADIGSCVSCASQPLGPGFYCQNNEAVLCPSGHYCPTYLEKRVCPKGKWCKAGFTEPLDCTVLIICPEGSEEQKAGLGLLLLMLWLVTMCCCMSCCISVRKVNAEKAMRQAAEGADDADLRLGDSFVHDTPQVCLGFENLSMRLRANGKCVLDNISGEFPASSLVALMGPSGGGKTTFMNALCGRASYGKVTGRVFINGQEGSIEDFPKLVGFVPQDDIMHTDLTVHQNILYNARLRLPASVSYKETVKHANHVVRTLGMDHVAHNIVGTPEQRGISGGQRKRVNIGMELAAMPSVIFMDEPTSGLDGAATIQLAKCLACLRSSGLTIVCVIHQPRYSVFTEFSHLLLLGAGGGQVYCGETSGVEPYLKNLGFRMPAKENPADWMIDVVCGLEPRYMSSTSDELDVTFTAPQDLFTMWDEHRSSTSVKDADEDEPKKAKMPKALTGDRHTPSVALQTWIFMTREVRKWNKNAFLGSCTTLFYCALLLGLMMQSATPGFSYAAVMSMLTGGGFLFFMICTINARNIFAHERMAYMREFGSGTSCIAYWLAKTLWSCLDCYFYSMCFSVPLYWTMPIPAQRFWTFFVAHLLAGWYHIGLGMVFSVVFSTPIASLLLCVFVPMVLQIAFSGGLIAVSDMSAPLKAVSELSCGRWYKSAVFVAEMQEFPSHTLDFPAVQATLDSYELSMADGKSRGFLMMFFLGCVFRVWVLAVLLTLRHAEGSSCFARMLNLLSKLLHRLGFDALFAPKKGDAADSVVVVQKMPSSSWGLKSDGAATLVHLQQRERAMQ